VEGRGLYNSSRYVSLCQQPINNVNGKKFYNSFHMLVLHPTIEALGLPYGLQALFGLA
jgi:hypothetical protein